MRWPRSHFGHAILPNPEKIPEDGIPVHILQNTMAGWVGQEFELLFAQEDLSDLTPEDRTLMNQSAWQMRQSLYRGNAGKKGA